MNSHEIVQTRDGSPTLFNAQIGDHYHSIHGAMQEALHVFIQAGLVEVLAKHSIVNLLEVGLGTGLNCALTLNHLSKTNATVKYTSLEPFPLEEDQFNKWLTQFNGSQTQSHDLKHIFASPWSVDVPLTERFTLHKAKENLTDFQSTAQFDIVYYDAFGPSSQPEMWELPAIEHVTSLMNMGGVFVTYCAQGAFRRNLEGLGLQVERIPGPPGKREMIRATK